MHFRIAPVELDADESRRRPNFARPAFRLALDLNSAANQPPACCSPWTKARQVSNRRIATVLVIAANDQAFNSQTPCCVKGSC